MRTVRKISQLVFLLFFLYLLTCTIYPLDSAVPTNLFLLLDPLVAVTTFIAGRVFVPALLWSLVLVASALLAGRIFCGWACPLGTTLDILDRIFHIKRLRARVRERRPRRIKYVLLIAVIVLAIFGLHAGGWVDPISLATRTYTTTLYPLVTAAATGALGESGSESTGGQVFAYLQEHGLPTIVVGFDYWWLMLAILGGLLALQVLGKRFWCRNLCPLGALLALFSRVQLVRFKVAEHCNECGECAPACKMAAIEEEEIKRSECILCWNCINACPVYAVKLTAGPPSSEYRLDLADTGRRAFLAAGVSAVPAVLLAVKMRFWHRGVIRPPGAVPEERFLATCTRCGQCLKVCPTNFLQQGLFESGIEGMLAPLGNPLRGYCEHTCTLCGEVCPTGAIPLLATRQKQATKIGIAKFIEETCLPFAKDTNCIVCEEHCPIPGKAIRLKAAGRPAKDGQELHEPYIVADLCNGCGICVYKCPVEGRRGVELLTLPHGF